MGDYHTACKQALCQVVADLTANLGRAAALLSVMRSALLETRGVTEEVIRHGRCLQMLGAQIGGPEQREFNGLQVEMWPRVSWSPSFVLTFADLEVSTHSMCMTATPHRRSYHMPAMSLLVYSLVVWYQHEQAMVSAI